MIMTWEGGSWFVGAGELLSRIIIEFGWMDGRTERSGSPCCFGLFCFG